MLKIYNIKDKPEYIEEVAILTQNEWGSKTSTDEEYKAKISKKINKILSLLDNTSYCKLILLEDTTLIGFISIFPEDGDDRKDLTPWYATMFVKKEFRGKGYSKILHEAILKEAKLRGFNHLYLKTELVNYYEKLGAVFIKNIDDKEKLYKINL